MRRPPLRSEAPIVLSLKGVEAGYGRIRALHGIDLEVRRGEIVTLLGANGAGKTTTLKTISGLVRATAGSITLRGPGLIGTQGQRHRPARRGACARGPACAARPQRAREPRARRLHGRRRRACAASGWSRCSRCSRSSSARQHQDGSLLSGGEQQMLAIGRALMHGPKVLLLDEPSMGLAPKLVLETLRIVKRLNEAGTTILLVEQNARLALKLAQLRLCARNAAASAWRATPTSSRTEQLRSSRPILARELAQFLVAQRRRLAQDGAGRRTSLARAASRGRAR